VTRTARTPSSVIAPIVRVRTQVVYNNKNWAPMYLYGTTPAFSFIRDWDWNSRLHMPELARGAFFEDRDIDSRSQVCVLGKTVVNELFGEDEDPIDKEIRINNQPFKVKGVLSSKGANMMGMDQDDIVLTPWTTLKFKWPASRRRWPCSPAPPRSIRRRWSTR